MAIATFYAAFIDFADALHLATMQKCKRVYTFDKALVKQARAIGEIAAIAPTSHHKK